MATKKISELPLVNRVSGSQVAGGSVLPIVIGGGIQGTTNQISVEDFSLFVNAYNATTSSNTFIGTQNVTGDVNISGRLTVKEVVAQYETASILFSTGSTKLGDELTDKHEFTGSTNITGSISVTGNSLLNGVSLNNSFDRLHQATQSLELFTSSQAARNLVLSTVTGSINQATASIQFQTASLLAFTASQDSRNFTLSQVTGSFNYFYQATASLENFTSSQADRNLVLSIVTGSINQATASLQFHSASVEAQLGRIQQATASLELASASFKYFYQSTASLQTFTASQADRNLVLSIVTGSINQATASLQFQTASLLAFTASQDVRNFVVSQVTGSLIGITNGLMAFTAALDNTYATDAQLYQLYQATRSIELHSGSMVGVTNGLMAYTASNTSLNTGLRGEVDGIEAYTASLKGQTIFSGSVQIPEIGGLEAYTASLKGQAIVSSSTQVQNYDVFALNSNLYTSTGSLIGITNGLMAFTAALDSTYATDAQLFQLYQATQSLELLSGSLIGITNGLMAFTAALDSTYATDAQLYQLYAETASIKAEIAGIEALTASFKAATIVSSSTQIQNYNVFAQTASANTFYGNQFITGGLNVNNGITGSVLGNLTGNASFATNTSNVALLRDNTDTTLYPIFSSTVAADTYSTLKGHASGTLYYNGLTQQLVVSGGGLVVTGSSNTTGSVNLIGTQTITGSLLVTGSITLTSGSITMPNRPAFRIVGTGGEVLAPYVLSGSKVSVDYNQGNHFNTTNGLFTAPIAGLYQVNLVIRTNSNTNSTINQAIVYKQSSAIDTAQIMVEFAANTTMNHSGGSTITKLDAGDTLRAQVVVGTCSFDGNNNFSVAYIG